MGEEYIRHNDILWLRFPPSHIYKARILDMHSLGITVVMSELVHEAMEMTHDDMEEWVKYLIKRGVMFTEPFAEYSRILIDMFSKEKYLFYAAVAPAYEVIRWIYYYSLAKNSSEEAYSTARRLYALTAGSLLAAMYKIHDYLHLIADTKVYEENHDKAKEIVDIVLGKKKEESRGGKK